MVSSLSEEKAKFLAEIANNSVSLMKICAMSILEEMEFLEKERTFARPKWVTGFIKFSGLEFDFPFQFGLPLEAGWQPIWGKPEDYIKTARRQLRVQECRELPKNGKIPVELKLRSEEYLISGGAHRNGIAVGIAGSAIKQVNDALAEIMITIVEMEISIKEENRARAEHLKTIQA